MVCPVCEKVSVTFDPYMSVALPLGATDNARTLVTLWGPADSTLHEYSYRLWGGLVGSFYYPRWAKWFAAVDAALAAKVKFNESAFYSEIEAWEEAWTGRRDAFPTAPAGGALRKAREVFARHFR